MNVASLELCKELYELSGWTDTDNRWYQDDGWYVGATGTNGLSAPAYDLGYLIRKAGGGAGVTKHSTYYTARRPDMFGAPENKDPLNGRIGWDGDTPEDAMCIMFIELIQKGLMDVETN